MTSDAWKEEENAAVGHSQGPEGGEGTTLSSSPALGHALPDFGCSRGRPPPQLLRGLCWFFSPPGYAFSFKAIVLWFIRF